MRKLIPILLLLSACSTTGYNQRLDGSAAGLMGIIIRNTASVAAGGSFDAERVAHETIYLGSSEVQSQVYDDYYARIREQHEREALEREYQAWAEREDRKNGVSKEEYFRKRYYGR